MLCTGKIRSTWCVVIGVFVLLALAGAADAGALRINNFDNWSYQAQNPNDESLKLSLLAQHDQVCLPETGGFNVVTPTSIKSLHPSARVYRYYSLIGKPVWDSDWSNPADTSSQTVPLTKAQIDANDWWLRDGSGNIIGAGTSGTYLDVGKPGLKEAYLKAVLQKISGQALDGVLLDDWCPTLSDSTIALSANGYSMPVTYPTDADWYQKAWQPYITYVTDGLRAAGYKVVGNCAGEYTSTNAMFIFQRSKCDGTVYEQWAIDWPSNGSGWLPGSTIQRRISCLANDPLIAWTADYGLRLSDPLYNQKKQVALAMYYVAIPQTRYADRAYNHYADAKVYWDSTWSFDIGYPVTASATQRTGSYFWSRPYTAGLVLLNYESSASIVYHLDQSYVDASGDTFSGDLTVLAHTAYILQSITGHVPPTVAVTSPTSNGTYTTAQRSVTIGGQASAASGLNITSVKWANSTGGSGACYGTTTWSASGVALQVGTNVITVTATDSSGQQASTSLTVVSQAPPVDVNFTPSATIIASGQSVYLTAVYSDPAGASNLTDCYVLVNTSSSTSGAAFLKYDAVGNLLYLRSDDDTRWLGGFAPGTSYTISNTQCRVQCARTTAQRTGSTLTAKWSVVFKSGLSMKACGVWLRVRNKQMLTDGLEKFANLQIR